MSLLLLYPALNDVEDVTRKTRVPINVAVVRTNMLADFNLFGQNLKCGELYNIFS